MTSAAERQAWHSQGFFIRQLPPDVVAAANDALAERVGVTDGVYLCPEDDEWMLLIPNALPEGVDACAALSRVAADVLMSMMDRVEL